MRRLAAAGESPTRRPISLAERRPSSSSCSMIASSIASRATARFYCASAASRKKLARRPARAPASSTPGPGIAHTSLVLLVPETEIRVLEAVQDRVLWLATSIVHHANRVRTTPSGVKVGGHQASSASIVSIMTALYFAHL